VTFIKSVNDRYRLYRLLDSLSKWSMADVFAMAIFVAFLTAKAVQEIKVRALGVARRELSVLTASPL
jgi:uncharacterized paraquat-inducible protein A